MMLSFFRKLISDARGNVLVLTAAGLPVLIGFVGLGTDTIQWTLWKRQIQRGADSGAIAAVYQRIQAANSLSDVKDAVAKDLSVNKNDVGTYVSGYPKIVFLPDTSAGKNQVEVELAVTRPLAFSSLFLSSPPIITTRAVAAVVPGRPFCVISTESTSKTGIMGSGNGTVNLDCGMITNSTSLNAAIAKGDATMNTDAIAAVGGIQESNNWVGAEYLPFSLPITDPYAHVPGTIPAGTPSRGAFNDQPGTVTDLQPGVYTNFNVQGTVNLAPGTYYLDGTNLSAGSQARIVGTGVTIVLTNSSSASTATIGGVNMNAGATMNLVAPTADSDVYKGIAIYQDRRAVDTMANGDTLSSSSPNQINGNAGTSITGSLYFPNQQITLNGTGTMDSTCTMMVVKRVVFSGNGTMNLSRSCDAADINPFEGRAIRLIA